MHPRVYSAVCVHYITCGAACLHSVCAAQCTCSQLCVVQQMCFLPCAANNSGLPMPIKASSWRSGAVCSAVAAGVSEAHIRALGRWTSDAWRSYLLQAPLDLHGSAGSMWRGPNLCLVPTTAGLGVAEFDVGGFFAPTIAREISQSLSALSIDIDNP